MKRPGQPRRTVELARGKSASPSRSSLPARSSGIRRKTPVRQSNPVAQAKKAARYKSYLSSAVWKAKRKAALELAWHRCEHVESVSVAWDGPGGVPTELEYSLRCEETTRLTVHHKSYARFGGDELPEDLQVLCKVHHDQVTAEKGQHRRRFPLTSKAGQQ